MSGNAVDSILQKLRKHRGSENSACGDVLARFLVAKISWRGVYRRVLVVTREYLRTYHPDNMSLTNSWSLHSELKRVDIAGDHPQEGGIVVLHLKKGQGTRDVRFACHERAGLVESIYSAAYSKSSGDGMAGNFSFVAPSQTLQAYKFRKGEWKAVLLRLTAIGVDRLDVRGGQVRWQWRFCHAASPAIRLLSGKNAPPGHVPLALCSTTGRSPRIYAVKHPEGFIKSTQSAAMKSLGIELVCDTSMDAVSPAELVDACSAAELEEASRVDEKPLSEWDVLKVQVGKIVEENCAEGEMHEARVVSNRRLVFTTNSLIERRSDSYDIAEWRHLHSVAALVRYIEEPQWLGVEWTDATERYIYISPQRDSILTSLLYAAQLASGRPIEILSMPTRPGDPLVHLSQQPVEVPVVVSNPIIESICIQDLLESCLQFVEAKGEELSLDALAVAGLTASLSNPVESPLSSENKFSTHIGMFEMKMRQFNASIPYSGVTKEANIDSVVVRTLLCYIPDRFSARKDLTFSREEETVVVLALHALQRLSTANHVRAYMLGAGGACGKIYSALTSMNDHVAVEAARLLLCLFSTSAIMSGRPTWKQDEEAMYPDAIARHDALAAARMAKAVCFISDSRCASIVYPIESRSTVSPVLASMVVEVIVAVACFPGAETTDLTTRESMIQQVSRLGRKLFCLFGKYNLPLLDGLAMLMRTIAEGGSRAAEPMRKAAMEEGAILSHLVKAVDKSTPENLQWVSRELVSLWCDSYQPAMDLVRRVFLPGLVAFLEKPRSQRKGIKPPPKDDASNSIRRGIFMAGGGSKGDVYQYNWEGFWEMIDRDHHHAALIWNETCRSELRDALKSEETMFRLGKQKVSETENQPASWNARDLKVHYPSLEDHMIVGGIYIKLLVESNDMEAIETLREPKEFFFASYLAFLRKADHSFQHGEADDWMSSDSLQAQIICVQAMSMVYLRHASVIGPFSDFEHIIDVFGNTFSRSMRYLVLDLFQSLLAPQFANEDEMVQNVAKSNATEFVRHGGVRLLCDAVATCHENSTSGPVTSKHLITGANSFIQTKIWYHGNISCDTKTGISDDELTREFSQAKTGPVSKKEIRHLYNSGQISGLTFFHRLGMKKPRPLKQIRELLWWCAGGLPPYPEEKFSSKAMYLLRQILWLCPARDGSGSALLPPPRAHREISSRDNISKIVQAMLTNNSAMVNEAAQLIQVIATQNDELMGNLYCTGVFFFCLAYSGTDMLEVARFLKVSHLRQKFRGSLEGKSSSLSSRSVLGDFLPESLLFILETYGEEAFCAAITRDAESPEIIWTQDMRANRLISHIWSHIGEFASLLKESWALAYDYTPCPPISYPEIHGEIWCHRYYLKHLCNEVKYPNWDIVDHVELLQSVLGSWRKELARQAGASAMTVFKALKVLELDSESKVSDEEMKKAFRRLARKYHPDRNPAGREMFEAVHDAYQFLNSSKEDTQGPRQWCILLYVQTQCVLYRRYQSTLRDFKYAGFPQLLSTIQISEGDEGGSQLLSENFIPLLAAILELCWLTCEASEMNAEELRRSGGVKLLSKLLTRCVSIMSHSTGPGERISTITTNILNAFASMSKFLGARDEIKDEKQLLSDAVHCCKLQKCLPLVSASLRFILFASLSEEAQDYFLSDGVIGVILPLFFMYEEGSRLEAEADPVTSQFAFMGSFEVDYCNTPGWQNRIALQAAETLAAVVGARSSFEGQCGEWNRDILAQECIAGLLTPAIARMLCFEDRRKLITTLNSEVSIPTAIWTSKMKEALLQGIENLSLLKGKDSLKSASLFCYNETKGEMFIAGVYVRLFIEQGDLNDIDVVQFCKALVKSLYLLQRLTPSDMDNDRALLRQVFALEPPVDVIECQEGEALAAMKSRCIRQLLLALVHLLDKAPKLLGLLSTEASIEPLQSLLLPSCLLGDFEYHWPESVEFPSEKWHALSKEESLFTSSQDAVSAARSSMAVFKALSSSSKCVPAIARSSKQIFFFWLLHTPPSYDILQYSAEILNILSTYDDTAKFGVDSAGIIYLLFFSIKKINILDPQLKAGLRKLQELCIQSISKMCSNTLHGRRVLLQLQSLLPHGLVAHIKEDMPDIALDAFHSDVETPELIWNSRMLAHLRVELERLTKEIRLKQRKAWRVNQSIQRSSGDYDVFTMLYPGMVSELSVEGVYIRLFLENPGFQIRDPQNFFGGLLAFVTQPGPPSNPEDLEQVCSSALIVLENYPNLIDYALNGGYVPKLLVKLQEALQQVRSKQEGLPLSAISSLRLLHALSSSSMSAESIARSKPSFMPLLMEGITHDDQMCLLSLETLKRLMAVDKMSRDLVVKAAIDHHLLPRLLELLDWNSSETDNEVMEEKAAARVLCVDVIHLLSVEGTYADAVRQVLESSDVWAAYAGQRHDLFLPAGSIHSKSIVGLIEGTKPKTYLLGFSETPHESTEENEVPIGEEAISEVFQEEQAHDEELPEESTSNQTEAEEVTGEGSYAQQKAMTQEDASKKTSGMNGSNDEVDDDRDHQDIFEIREVDAGSPKNEDRESSKTANISKTTEKKDEENQKLHEDVHSKPQGPQMYDSCQQAGISNVEREQQTGDLRIQSVASDPLLASNSE